MLHNIDFRVYAYFNKLVAIINKSKHWTVIIIIWNSFVYNMMSNDNYIFCFRLTKMKEEFRTKDIQLKKEQEELRRVQEKQQKRDQEDQLKKEQEELRRVQEEQQRKDQGMYVH
ncbi:Golgi resident protein GCP60-like isoform X2 [Ruditapes philippinarum]|uniref:Golgi resident protein GCP60-like isoform X2 n=1 Tax=Ruditapes philippinarum TaxID=129788 RepID=UPI00295BBAE0|nr:Golgi resident protein GCP60-like isoform X2 [Ruditapes philippinarum]